MNGNRFDFNGFRSLREYESECSRMGYTTQRIPFHKNGDSYFVLVTSPPHKLPTNVSSWTLFPADESSAILDGIINGVYENFLGKLADHGFYPEP